MLSMRLTTRSLAMDFQALPIFAKTGRSQPLELTIHNLGVRLLRSNWTASTAPAPSLPPAVGLHLVAFAE